MTFAEWLTQELARQGLRPADLAKRAGVSAASVSRWTRGIVTPDPPSCQIIAQALGVPADVVLVQAGHRPDLAAAQEYDLERRLVEIQELLSEAQLPGPNMARIPILQNTDAGTAEAGVIWVPAELLDNLGDPAVILADYDQVPRFKGVTMALLLIDRAALPRKGDVVAVPATNDGPTIRLLKWDGAAPSDNRLGVVRQLTERE